MSLTSGTATARLDGTAVEAFSGPPPRARVSFDANRLTVESWSVLR